MADIRINSLPEEMSPVASEVLAIDGATTRKATIQAIVYAGRPAASQAEAEAGSDANKAMTPLTTKQAITVQVSTAGRTGDYNDLSNKPTLGTAAVKDVEFFATAGQGALADSSLQPEDIGVSVGDMVASSYDPTGKNQNVYAQAFRDDSPRYFGATGDGTTDDTTAYQLAEAGLSSVFLPGGNIFDIGTAVPAKPVSGPGSIISNGVTLGGAHVLHYADRSSLDCSPDTFTDTDWLYDDFPAASNQGNTLFGSGARNLLDSNFVRTTAFGALNLMQPVSVDRVTAVGQGVLRHTQYAQRVDAFGSLNCQWGGTDLSDDASGEFYHHDLIYNDGGALLVSGSPGSYTLNAGWTADNLFDLDGTVGQSIVDWLNTDPWPTVNTDFSYIQAFGRDALCEIIKGTGDVAFGYRALGLLLEGDDNTAVGNNALFNMVFGDQNTAMGRNAGFLHQTGNANVYLGRNAGYKHYDGANSIFIGNNAGNPSVTASWSGDGSIFIGNGAGSKPDGTIDATVDDRLFIQNLATRSPLISGDFASGKIGVNLPIANPWRGMLHLFQGASGLNISDVAATGADGFVLENSAHAGFTILTPNTQIGGLFFADPEGLQQGGVSYNHSNDQLRLRIAGSNSFVISTTLANSLVPFARNGTQVLDTRKTGWGAPTGTATRTTFATSTVTLPQLAEHVKALIDDLTSHGLIGA